LKTLVGREEDIESSEEGPFPAKILLSEQETPTASVKLGTPKEGRRIEPHMHNECDQLEYHPKGRALMFPEGLGERKMLQGSFTYILKGVRHGILNVAEPLTVITVFVPPLF